MAHLGKWMILAVLCFIGESALGAPSKARYMWLRCRPDGKNANCVKEKGPIINLDKYPDAPKALPSSAVKNLLPKETGQDPEEQSGDNAGTEKHIPAFPVRGSGDQLIMDTPLLGKEESSGMAEGSGEFDYSDVFYPERVPYWEEYEKNYMQ